MLSLTLTGVYLIRFVFELPAQKAWNKFDVEDLKFNKRMFSRLMDKEVEIYTECALLQALPRSVCTTKPNSKRVRDIQTSLSDTESPVKRVYTIDSDTTDDEEK